MFCLWSAEDAACTGSDRASCLTRQTSHVLSESYHVCKRELALLRVLPLYPPHLFAQLSTPLGMRLRPILSDLAYLLR